MEISPSQRLSALVVALAPLTGVPPERIVRLLADAPNLVGAVERALRGGRVAVRVTVSGLTVDCVFRSAVAEAPEDVDPGGAACDQAAETLAAGGFSARQAEILCWLARGLRQSEIARRLFVSPSTVHSHTGTLRERLGVATTTELRHYAQARGWHLLVGDDGSPPD